MRTGRHWPTWAERILVGLMWLWASALTGLAADAPPRRDVTFLSTSDSHYREAERKAQNERNRVTLIEMNQIAGFFVVQIVGDRLRLAYRCREGVKITRLPDKSESYEWGGEWGWRWLLDKRLAVAPPGRQ